MPVKETCYRWDDVPGTGFCFLRFGDNKHIITAAVRPELNPDAPEIILVKKGEPRESRTQKLCEQSKPISVYLRRDRNKWEYCGNFLVKRFSDLEEEIHHHEQRSKRDDIFGIIYLKECEDEKEKC